MGQDASTTRQHPVQGAAFRGGALSCQAICLCAHNPRGARQSRTYLMDVIIDTPPSAAGERKQSSIPEQHLSESPGVK